MIFADTHCHLDFNAFDDDRDAVIARAREAGIDRILNPGIDVETSRAAVRLAARYAEVYAAVGVHPNDASGWNSDTLQHLEELAAQPKVLAIGEIGLDYYRDRTPRDVQMVVFQAQLELAEKLGLPVVIHNREAGGDVLAVLGEWQRGLAARGLTLGNCPGVLHSFSESPEYAMQVIGYNFLVGITGPVTYKNAELVRKVVELVPPEALLTETDAPFLAPQAVRGQRNEPEYMVYTAKKMAETKQMPVETLAKISYDNARRMLKW